MRFIKVTLLSVLLAGCASSPGPVPGHRDTRFEDIANEWRGAHINDMIHVWGDPRVLDQDETQDGAGSAMWAIFSKYTDRRTRCEATATFDAAGTIHDIAVASLNCPPKRRFSWRENWDIEQLRRPVATGTNAEAAGGGR